MSDDPNYRVADAMRTVALRLDEAFESGKVACVYANQLAEILLSIAEELDPPLRNRDQTTKTTEL
ncbi:MAG: hypothetical protein ACKOOI_06860 [Pirellula sp.]